MTQKKQKNAENEAILKFTEDEQQALKEKIAKANQLTQTQETIREKVQVHTANNRTRCPQNGSVERGDRRPAQQHQR